MGGGDAGAMTTAPLPAAVERTHAARSAALLALAITVVLGVLVGGAVLASQAVELMQWFAAGR